MTFCCHPVAAHCQLILLSTHRHFIVTCVFLSFCCHFIVISIEPAHFVAFDRTVRTRTWGCRVRAQKSPKNRPGDVLLEQAESANNSVRQNQPSACTSVEAIGTTARRAARNRPGSQRRLPPPGDQPTQKPSPPATPPLRAQGPPTSAGLPGWPTLLPPKKKSR